MKNFKNRFLAVVLIMGFFVSFIGPSSALAATSPSLGAADVFSIIASTFQHNGGLTTMTGSLGYAGEAGGGPLSVGGTTEVNNASWTAAGGAQNNTLATGLDTQACTFTFAAGAINLSTDTTHGQIGVYTPGVYCVNGAASVGTAGLTLNGSGTYIFRMTGALDTADNSQILSAGASSCDVFWTPGAATTLGANTTFIGNILDASGITIGSTTTLNGRALAYGGTVTTTADIINSSCVTGTAPAPAPIYSGNNNTITVFKQVINDNGGTALFSDFPLFINGVSVKSGESVSLVPGTYTITETNKVGYTGTFTGNCNASGVIIHGGTNTHNDICTITNNDNGVSVIAPVPPLIDVVKTVLPLSLPVGGGMANYTYTLRNIGTVPVTNVTMLGDTCSPIILASGDVNSDAKLDLNETWVYTCSKMTFVNHTNTVVATGWANGINAVDVASATILVGLPVTSPLIHVVKIPNPLTLPLGAGNVLYTYTVTNPGAVPLANVTITDDKCTSLPGRVVGHPGDLNQNNLLESNESWVFTCQSYLTKTTTNTAIATGTANGLTATDFALATVVVSVPSLPKTGFPPQEKNNVLVYVVLFGLALVGTSFVALKKSKI